MMKRMFLMLAAVVLFIAGVGTYKFLQIRAAIAQGAWTPPPEAVTTVVVREDHWPTTIQAIGTVEAVHGVTVSADLSGIVDAISFESGRAVRTGDVLVRLDTSQEKAQLAAAEARRKLAGLNLDRLKSLVEKNVASQSELDRIQAEFDQAEAGVGEIKATIERKTIRAPFAGVLGLRQVNLGQYLNGGDPIVSLQSMSPVYVNFSVPQGDVGDVSAGAVVEISLEGADTLHVTGKVTAVNAIVDEGTRNIQVQATFDNADGRLHPGMFVDTHVMLGDGRSVVTIPTSAVNFAPYGDSIFIVEDMAAPGGKNYKGVRQQFVKLGPSRGDQVAVLSGLKSGEEVVTSGVFKLRNSAAVKVNNEITPSNSPSPKPEDS